MSFSINDIEHQADRLKTQSVIFDLKVSTILYSYNNIANVLKSGDNNLFKEINKLVEVYDEIRDKIDNHFQFLEEAMFNYVNKSRGNVSNAEEGIQSSNSNLENISSMVGRVGDGSHGTREVAYSPNKFD